MVWHPVCDAHVRGLFAEKDFVFEQGDVGDAFYVIVSGEAVVLRDEGQGDVELRTYGEGDFFGERALIKNDKRFASIQVTLVLPRTSAAQHETAAPYTKLPPTPALLLMQTHI